MDPDTFPADPLVEQILELFAHEARIDRALLLPQARVDSLGATSLDLTLAFFELEDRFDLQLPDMPAAGVAVPTVGDVVRQVLEAQRLRQTVGPAAEPAIPANPDPAMLLNAAP